MKLKFLNIATILTLMRLLAVPLIVVVYYLPSIWAHRIAAFIFLGAAITDWFDGYLARTLSLHTEFGAFLDPVADKLLIAVSLILIVGEGYIHWLTIPAAIIVGREIAISALREWMAEIGKRVSLAVSYIAKWKTTIQMVALFLLLWFTPGNHSAWSLWIGTFFLCAAAFLTLWTMVFYLKIAWPDLTYVKEQE